MSTPHNEAKKGEIAARVLMPGDPLRAKFIAENWLEGSRLVNRVRNMYAYTGSYRGQELTVMASGMGMPSIGIYSYELYRDYNVEGIVRVGSAGAYTDALSLMDVVLAREAWSETSFAKTQNGFEGDTVYPDASLNRKLMLAARELALVLKPVKVHSCDVFYCENNVDNYQDIYRKHGCACIDMESFALFHNAAVLGKKAACLLTISDSFTSGEKLSAGSRQLSFSNMIKIALEALIME